MIPPPGSDLQAIADGMNAQADPPTSPEGSPVDATGEDNVRPTRIGVAWAAVALAVVLGVGLIAFIVQNTHSIQIKFFGASGHVPAAAALLIAAVIGGLVVVVVAISRITHVRISARRRSRRAKDAAK
jgi:uncharacterized integral membrane protein